MKKPIVIKIQDLVIFNETNNNLNFDDISIVAVLPDGKGILLTKAQIGGGGGGTIPDLQAVLTQGDSADKSIDLAKLNSNTLTVGARRSGASPSGAYLQSNGTLVIFNGSGTAILNANDVTDIRNLKLPDEDGTFATREWVDMQKPLALITTLTTTGSGVAPVVYINRNNLTSGETPITITYVSVGTYEVIISGMPTGYLIDDIHISFGNFIYEALGGAVVADGINYLDDVLTFIIKTKVNPSTFADFLLAKTPMKIELYKPL